MNNNIDYIPDWACHVSMKYLIGSCFISSYHPYDALPYDYFQIYVIRANDEFNYWCDCFTFKKDGDSYEINYDKTSTNQNYIDSKLQVINLSETDILDLHELYNNMSTIRQYVPLAYNNAAKRYYNVYKKLCL